MQEYYAARASEYDRVYLKPERQADLRQIEQWLPTVFAGKSVLEVACGTGYWTQFIAPVAAAVVAVDAAPETLDNRYVEGSSTPICERDAEGNTYQLRRLSDGSAHRVLKNFPARAELLASIKEVAVAASYLEWHHYWALQYTTSAP